MGMTCPRCRVLLSEVTRAGVVADTCGTCRGMWLDRGELQEMVAPVDGLQRVKSNGIRCIGAADNVITRTEHRPLSTGAIRGLRCPRCSDILRQTQRNGVRVDECRRCRGVWLDDGELQRIRASLRELRSDWERDEDDPGRAIRWYRPLRYPRHHPRRHLPPQVPPRDPRRSTHFWCSPVNRGGSPDGMSDPARSLDDTKANENAQGRHETQAGRHHNVFGKLWNICRPTTGTLLILLGFFLMFVPVLPGTPLILVGMAVAGSSHPIVRFLRERWRRWTKEGA